MSKTIAIIGAGIVGVSTALWAQRDGHRVVLIDKAGPGEGTSYGNGGVLASCGIVPVTGPGLIRKAPRMALDPAQPLFLKYGYLPRMLPWLVKYLSHANAADTARITAALAGVVMDSLAEHQALAKGTGAARWIVPSDYLYLYDNTAHFEGDRFAWTLRQQHGLTWENWDGDALQAYDPGFADIYQHVAKLADHGRIADPGRYVKDLAAHVGGQGGQLIKGTVEDVARENGRVTGVQISGEVLACDAVVLATGVWSGPLAQKLGLTVPLETERGYHLELWEPSIVPRAPVMIAGAKFVITPMEGRIRLAGIVEFGGLDAPPTRAAFDLLRRNVQAAMPSLTWRYEQEWMGHRPAPADSIPVIGAVPGLEGAFTGFGHHHIGLTAGPKTGRLLAQLLSERKPNLDLSTYSPARYAS